MYVSFSIKNKSQFELFVYQEQHSTHLSSVRLILRLGQIILPQFSINISRAGMASKTIFLSLSNSQRSTFPAF